jgi:hypothetical protein
VALFDALQRETERRGMTCNDLVGEHSPRSLRAVTAASARLITFDYLDSARNEA